MAVAHAFHDPADRAFPENLADAAARARLTPAAIAGLARLADIWRLSTPEICALIGDVSERTL